MIDTSQLTGDELRRVVFALIAREMGPDALIRFHQMYSRGSGDYSEHRHAWLDSLSAADIVREIENQRR